MLYWNTVEKHLKDILLTLMYAPELKPSITPQLTTKNHYPSFSFAVLLGSFIIL
jgi:hypothetical protein